MLPQPPAGPPPPRPVGPPGLAASCRRPWLKGLRPVTKFTEVLPTLGDSEQQRIERLHCGLRTGSGDASVSLPPLGRRQRSPPVSRESATRKKVHDGWEIAASRRTKETMRYLREISNRRQKIVQKHTPKPPCKNQPACAFARLRAAGGGIDATDLFIRDDELKAMEVRNRKAQEIAQERRQLFQDLGAASRECAQEYRTSRDHIRDQRKRVASSGCGSIHSFLEGLANDAKGTPAELGDHSASVSPAGAESSSSRKTRRKTSLLNFNPWARDPENNETDIEIPDSKLQRLKFSMLMDMREDSDQEDAENGATEKSVDMGRKSLMPKLHSSRNDRLRLLSILGSQSRRQDSARNRMECRRKKFEALPEKERDAFTIAFEQGKEEDDMEHSLTVLGLQGRNETEKEGIAQLCAEIADGEIDLLDFCFDLVPRVRSFLREMQRPRLMELFQKFDSDKSGFLDPGECTEIAERLCIVGLDPEGGAQLRAEFDNLLKETIQNMHAKKASEAQVEAETSVSVTEVQSKSKMPGFLRDLKKKKSNQENLACEPKPVVETDDIDFDAFEELIAKVQEAKEAIQRSRELTILQETNLSSELFIAHKDELILLYEAFQTADQNGNGSLEWNEVAGILIDCGLLPRDQCEQKKIEALLSIHDADGNGAIDFEEFLSMMQDVRAAWRKRLEPELQDLFKKYDKDNGGSLSLAEVATMIGDMGLNPRTREDQDEIKQLLDNVDADGSGELDFAEFQDLVQRIEEKLKSLQRRRDLKAGEALGFTPQQVCELRGVFFKLDVNGDESISPNEIQQLAMILKKRIKIEHLMNVFHEVDGEDGNGSLDFVKFMTIVSRLNLL